nr:MAG TPA: hypothetical protein [Caudoviricetes sp.]
MPQSYQSHAKPKKHSANAGCFFCILFKLFL